MKKIQIIVFVLILTACVQQPVVPQVTVTSKVTVTLTPTATFTVVPTFTPTPTASATPLPELPPETIAAIETQLPGYTVTGDQLINKETGKAVSDWHVVPSADGRDWSYQSTYAFGDNPAFTEVIPNELIKVSENGEVVMEGYYTNEAGEIVQETVLAQENGNGDVIQTEIPVETLSKYIERLRQETEIIKKANEGKIPDDRGAGIGFYDSIFELSDSRMSVLFGGSNFRKTHAGSYYDAFDSVRISEESDTKGVYVDEATLRHVWIAVGLRPETTYTMGGFFNHNGDIEIHFIDRDLNTRNVTEVPNTYTPFRVPR